jgi:hypothetical protein
MNIMLNLHLNLRFYGEFALSLGSSLKLIGVLMKCGSGGLHDVINFSYD